MEKTQWWDKRRTPFILKLDYAYIEKLILNYEYENYKLGGVAIGNGFYQKPELTCQLCGKGSKKRKWRPACFFPTEVGYFYKCTECEPSMTLYRYLLDQNPSVASKYQMERWRKNLTGSSYNCPEPPKNIKKEYYQRLEREKKDLNKIAYKLQNQKDLM